MSVSTGNLEIHQGMDYIGTVFIENQDGTPADLSVYSGAAAQLRRGPADHYPLDAEIECTIILPDEVRLFIPKAVTTTLCGRYEWDLDLLPDEKKVMSGQAVIILEITRQVVMAARR